MRQGMLWARPIMGKSITYDAKCWNLHKIPPEPVAGFVCRRAVQTHFLVNVDELIEIQQSLTK